MYYVYIIKSKISGLLYIGYTSDLKRRFKEHNANQSAYTKHKGPWKLVYYESYLNKQDAIAREHNLKQFKSSYGHLKKRIKRSIDED